MTDNINIEKPLPIKTYNVSKVNEKLKRLEEAIESGGSSIDIVAGDGISITGDTTKTITNTAPGVEYTAGDGISISEGVISNILPGMTEQEIKALVESNWKVIHKNERSNLITDNALNRDICIILGYGSSGGKYIIFIPKGYPTNINIRLGSLYANPSSTAQWHIFNACIADTIYHIFNYEVGGLTTYITITGIEFREVNGLITVGGLNIAWQPTILDGVYPGNSDTNFIGIMVRE